jgi:HemY protein
MPLALRLVATFLLLAAVSALALWLRDHAGVLRMDWLGYRIETPLAVALTLLAISLVTLILLIYGLVRLSHLPLRYRLRKQESRFRGSLDELTYALTSLAVADHAGALRHARLAEKQLGDHPLLDLVRAHVARRTQDSPGAQRQLEKMLAHPTTRMLAASALSHLAHREQRLDEAVRLAETAYEMQPAHKPNLHALLALYLEQEAWEPALLLIEKARRLGHLSRAEAKHQEALLYWEQSASLTRAGDAAGSALLIRQAFRSDPGFVPAAHEHAARLMAGGHRRRAAAALKRAWKHQPHPMLADLYLGLHAASTQTRLAKAVESLTKSQPAHLESHLARAQAAMRLTLWDEARQHLARAMDVRREGRIYRLLAELERRAGQPAAATAALEQAEQAEPDSSWLCDACEYQGRDWQRLCPRCDSADTLHWRAPEMSGRSDGFAAPFDLRKLS